MQTNPYITNPRAKLLNYDIFSILGSWEFTQLSSSLPYYTQFEKGIYLIVPYYGPFEKRMKKDWWCLRIRSCGGFSTSRNIGKEKKWRIERSVQRPRCSCH